MMKEILATKSPEWHAEMQRRLDTEKPIDWE
jgi:hypothetical protein